MLFQEKPQNEETGFAAVSVLVPYPVDKAYDYAVPDDLEINPGDYVTVPLGRRQVIGVVWGPGEGNVAQAKLKPVLSRHDLPPMPQIQRDFIDWVADYTMSARGSVLKMCLSAPGVFKSQKQKMGYRLVHAPHLNPPPLRRGEEWRGVRDKSRNLRTHATDAEKKLWLYLRKKQQACRFRRQYAIPPYIVDFICLEKKLIIELDGGQHHEQKNYDAARTAFLKQRGYQILRFWNNEILENLEGCLNVIAERLTKHSCPSPNPLPTGERAFCSLSEFMKTTGYSAARVKTLVKKGEVETAPFLETPPCVTPDANRKGANLSPAQEGVAARLASHVKTGLYHAALLDGVTGAGKTEVYFEAVAECLRQGRQVLILLPEIALSNAFLDRFQSRFGCVPALWHSGLTPARRRVAWRGVAEGQSKVVVGARSALFLPYADLGLIIVDEEHDPAYKQEEGVIYHARDMAVARAHLSRIPVVLVSATPSLETVNNAWMGRYEHLHLPDRFGGANLPDVHVIDMRKDKPERQHFIAPSLRQVIKNTLNARQQVLLFLNRRGYAPLTLCRACGHRMECPRCTAWLVEHKRGSRLECHHCGYHLPKPKTCPKCSAPDSLAACGPGVERILEEVKALFPQARTLLLASDTADSNDHLRAMLNDIRDHKVDIIIGTQIIAKGHHFPHLTCVGVIDADLGLQGGELRAAERTYQLLYQVAGRAGREAKKGHVYLQTWLPDHRIIKALAAGERDRFLEVEAHERQMAHMPPYARLAGIILSGRDESRVFETAKALGAAAPHDSGFQVLGPAPAPFARLRGKYRYRLLVRSDKSLALQKTMALWIRKVKIPPSVDLQIDIDPQSFF